MKQNPKFRSISTLIASLAGISLLISGCGGDSTPQSGDTSAPETNNVSDATYTVTDAYGEVKFDKVPERIVVLDSPALDALIALNITPVGAPEVSTGSGFPAYLADKLTDTKVVGNISEW